MKINTEKLAAFFENALTLRLVQAAAPSPSNNTFKREDLAGYLNLIRPHLICIIGQHEFKYLNALSVEEQKNLIGQLTSQQTLYLIFEYPYDIPRPFFQQNTIHLIQSGKRNTCLQRQLAGDLNEHFAERRSQHGAFVIIYGQGILITGNSGAGKSSLLLGLVKLGHLWVADDMTLFYVDSNNQVIGHAVKSLSEYIHIKGLGPICMDKIHGLTCRIRSHPLAATIHLSDNDSQENQKVSAYTQRDTMTLFDKNFPKWHFASSSQNLALLVESCAKNLILKNWGCDATDELESALSSTLLSNTRQT